MSIKSLPNIERDKAQAEIDRVVRSMGDITRGMKVIAKVRKAAYDAHIEAGFTEKQAIELVKKL